MSFLKSRQGKAVIIILVVLMGVIVVIDRMFIAECLTVFGITFCGAGGNGETTGSPPSATILTPSGGDIINPISSRQVAKGNIGFYTRYSYEIPLDIKITDSDGDFTYYKIDKKYPPLTSFSEIKTSSILPTSFVLIPLTLNFGYPYNEYVASPPTSYTFEIKVRAEDTEALIYDNIFTITVALKSTIVTTMTTVARPTDDVTGSDIPDYWDQYGDVFPSNFWGLGVFAMVLSLASIKVIKRKEMI